MILSTYIYGDLYMYVSTYKYHALRKTEENKQFLNYFMDFRFEKWAMVATQPVSADRDVLIPMTVKHINYVNSQ